MQQLNLLISNILLMPAIRSPKMPFSVASSSIDEANLARIRHFSCHDKSAVFPILSDFVEYFFPIVLSFLYSRKKEWSIFSERSFY